MVLRRICKAMEYGYIYDFKLMELLKEKVMERPVNELFEFYGENREEMHR